MKTVEVVVTARGWHVTRRYAGMNKGAEFFLFGKNATERETNEAKKDKYIKDWVGV